MRACVDYIRTKKRERNGKMAKDYKGMPRPSTKEIELESGVFLLPRSQQGTTSQRKKTLRDEVISGTVKLDNVVDRLVERLRKIGDRG